MQIPMTRIGALLFAGLLFCATSTADAAPEIRSASEPVPEHTLFEIDSTIMGEKRRITVYLPPKYAKDGGATFPVLYMPDGGLAEDFPHVAATVDAGIRAGEIVPMLVVGIENTVRRRDMTPPTQVASDREVAPVVGHSATFRAFIADELIPEIERRYRVNDERAIIGESLAGLFIVETFFAQPDLFDTWVALSPSLWWNDRELVREAADWLQAHPRVDGRLFLAAANEEGIAAETSELAAVLQAQAPKTLHWTHTPRPDLRHDTIYRSMAPPTLRALFAPEAEANPASDTTH